MTSKSTVLLSMDKDIEEAIDGGCDYGSYCLLSAIAKGIKYLVEQSDAFQDK